MIPHRLIDHLGKRRWHLKLTAYGNISPGVAARLMDADGVLLIEVREPAARTDLGRGWGDEAAFQGDLRRFIAEENHRRRLRRHDEPAIRWIAPMWRSQRVGEVVETG